MLPGKTLIIIPTFNERENIVSLVDQLLELYTEADVLVVDDSSADGTADAVRNAQSRHGTRLQLLVRSGKGGRGSAVLEGVKRALSGGYEFAVEMDADFSHRPQEVELLFTKMSDADCVIGSRYLPGSDIRDWGWKRTVFSALANRYARTILRMPLTDYTNGFRCYNRKALEALEPARIDAKGYVVLSAMAYQLYKKGVRFAEVPTLFVNRRRGVSNLGFHEINEAFFSILQIRWPQASLFFRHIGPFALRGTVAALIDLGALALLSHVIQLTPLMALTLSSIVALTCMVLLRQPKWGRTMPIRIDRFLIVYGAASLFTIGIAITFHQQLGWSLVASKTVGILLAAPINYVLSRMFLSYTPPSNDVSK